MSDFVKQFKQERADRIAALSTDKFFNDLSGQWLTEAMRRQYTYNYTWLGQPIIQYPQDIAAVQELVWSVKPDLIIETGIAHGGSLLLSASLLAILDVCDSLAAREATSMDTLRRKVIGIDIDIRAHNRDLIESHPLAAYIEMFEGSSISSPIIEKVTAASQNFSKIMVFLDAMHTHAHVMSELDAYAPLVTTGSYCVVFDTFVEDMPKGFFANRPWDVGNNPKTAVHEWLKRNSDFEIDKAIEQKLQVTSAPDGFLRRMSKHAE